MARRTYASDGQELVQQRKAAAKAAADAHATAELVAETARKDAQALVKDWRGVASLCDHRRCDADHLTHCTLQLSAMDAAKWSSWDQRECLIATVSFPRLLG